jgi:hypothetical protein
MTVSLLCRLLSSARAFTALPRGWTNDHSRFDSRERTEIYLCSKGNRAALASIWHPIWVRRGYFPRGLKRPAHEAEHSPPSSIHGLRMSGFISPLSYFLSMYIWFYSCLIVCLCMASLTEVLPCFFLSCKPNARVKPAKTGHGPHSF